MDTDTSTSTSTHAETHKQGPVCWLITLGGVGGSGDSHHESLPYSVLQIQGVMLWFLKAFLLQDGVSMDLAPVKIHKVLKPSLAERGCLGGSPVKPLLGSCDVYLAWMSQNTAS